MKSFSEPQNPLVRRFRMEGIQCIIQPRHLGLANGLLTLGTPHTRALCVNGLFAPPYASSDFSFDVQLCGESVKTDQWTWYPNMIFRKAAVQSLEVSSVTALAAQTRGAVMHIMLHNPQDKQITIPWTIRLGGGAEYVRDWDFSIPRATKKGELYAAQNALVMKNDGASYGVSSSLSGLEWSPSAGLWQTAQTLLPGQTIRVMFAFHIGPPESVTDALSSDGQALLDSAYADLDAKVEHLFSRLPAFESPNKELEAFYYRSLTSLLMNTWRVKEFSLQPYFSTGSVNGGCLASYLWDLSAGAEILPLFDAAATKEQIKAYFRINIFKSFAFLPVGANAYGPWYPVNQEKIVSMVYHYVRLSGDRSFLLEKVEGKSVMDWILENAFFGCYDGKVRLIDYGAAGESHLELRRGYPYHGVMPDLNARRYATCLKAAELCKLCALPQEGFPQEQLPQERLPQEQLPQERLPQERLPQERLPQEQLPQERLPQERLPQERLPQEQLPQERLLACAREIKALVCASLWDKENRWFRYIADGKQDLRYTVQMFKLCDSGVLEPEMLEGLLSHLNEEEFLSPYGLHSMSKKDPAYDQVDIDNGGGGSCTIFPTVIAQKLYSIKRFSYADDMMRRVLWWGTRMPYWGDSFVANEVDYRQDTPLQCAIGSLSGAQYILFGIAGIEAGAHGEVSVNPHLPSYAPSLSLKNIRLHNKIFSLELLPDGYAVMEGGRRRTAAYGEKLSIQ